MKLNEKTNCTITACCPDIRTTEPTTCAGENCMNCNSCRNVFEAHFNCDGVIDFLDAEIISEMGTTIAQREELERFMGHLLEVAETMFSSVPNGICIENMGSAQALERVVFRCNTNADGETPDSICFIRNTTTDRAVIAAAIYIENNDGLLPEVHAFIKKATELVVDSGLFTLCEKAAI